MLVLPPAVRALRLLRRRFFRAIGADFCCAKRNFFAPYRGGDLPRRRGAGGVTISFARPRRRKLHIACFTAKRQKCAHSAASPLKITTASMGCNFAKEMGVSPRAGSAETRSCNGRKKRCRLYGDAMPTRGERIALSSNKRWHVKSE